jgi:glycosyltransferase involved in cell wall biosynthesis
MRFLMLNWRDPKNPRAGGAERVTLGYLSALAQRGHEVLWFTYDFEGAVPVETLDGVTVVRGGSFLTSVVEVVVWCRTQKRFDLVIDQHHGIPWAAPLWCRTRCVAYLHEVLGPIWSSFYPWPLNEIGQWQERWTHRLYRRVPFWTASQFTKDALLRHAHVLLHTSQREGWGLNVIEANAMGTPAVVYPVAGLVESTLHRETGLVAKKETPDALADRLQDLLKAPEAYQRYRRNAWERAKSFHWSNVLPRACNWLEGQARRSPARGPELIAKRAGSRISALSPGGPP